MLVENQLGKRIQAFRSDSSGEFDSTKFKQHLETYGIQCKFTAPYTPEQNGVAECTNHMIIEGTLAMLTSSRLPKQFWAEAASTFVYLSNHCMNATSKVTPYELWHGKAPDVSHLRVFGCLTYIHVPKEKRRKLDSRAVKGVHLDYDGAGYHIWNLTAKRIVITQDVTHDETVQGWMGQPATRIEALEKGNLETPEPGIVPVEVSEAVDKPPEASEQLDNDEPRPEITQFRYQVRLRDFYEGIASIDKQVYALIATNHGIGNEPTNF